MAAGAEQAEEVKGLQRDSPPQLGGVWTPLGLLLCVCSSKVRLLLGVLRVTSGLWPEGLAGYLTWTGTHERALVSAPGCG